MRSGLGWGTARAGAGPRRAGGRRRRAQLELGWRGLAVALLHERDALVQRGQAATPCRESKKSGVPVNTHRRPW
jgi:hypothetical protein